MKEIKKVTSDGEINMAEIRAGQAPVPCDDTTCHLQCSCPTISSVDHFVLSRDYYETHYYLWNQ